MGLVTQTVNQVSPVQSVVKVNNPKSLSKNAMQNFNAGSKTCPIVNEGSGLGDGITQGDLSKVCKNAAALGIYAVPLG